MRINKKKFIYLISPNKIRESFYHDLIEILKLKKVSFFQLRLKNTTFKKKLIIGKKIKDICKKYQTKFLINDDVLLAQKLDADGCHLGQKDINIFRARKLIPHKIIGITCHNSKKLANSAISNKAYYLAFGAFNKSTTQKTKFKTISNILKDIKNIKKTPLISICGLNHIITKKLP